MRPPSCETSSGSSPRLRGTAEARLVNGSGAQVHPRACGEQGATWESAELVAGSSPRLRGTGLQAGERHGLFRFIPAPAGNSPPPESVGEVNAVHPRACGEQRSVLLSWYPVFGSSPRLRGTGVARKGQCRGHRFIPAPAGNSKRGRGPGPPLPVHPRACGEQRSDVGTLPDGAGSSPRLRGTATVYIDSTGGHRFIPAPAGNRRPGCPRPRRHTVHPRACGEQITSPSAPRTFTGSSPRLRGTARRRFHGSPGRRFIPAPAGNSRYRAAAPA